MVNDQVITENYAVYNGDSCLVLPTLPDESIHLSVYSPPFAGLYQYSSADNDLSNCASYEQFMEHYRFIVSEKYRITMKGRLSVVHVTDVPAHKNGLLTDFPGDVIRLHKEEGWGYAGRFVIWKDPLKVAIRLGYPTALKHGQIVEDASRCRPALPDYMLIFVKPGENPVPVTHEHGLGFGCGYYAGALPLTPEMEGKYGSFDQLKRKYLYGTKFTETHKGSGELIEIDPMDQRQNKLSHVIWQRYASPVWDDIRIDNVLKHKEARENEEEKHVHPLQLDAIDRIVELYTNPGETVLTPFMGVGSEVYSPVSAGRKGIGIELKETYFRQAVENLKETPVRFAQQAMLF